MRRARSALPARPAWLLLLCALAAPACRCDSDNPQPNPPPETGTDRPEPPPAAPSYGVEVGPLKLELPKRFQVTRKFSRERQILFLDEKKQDGYRATVLVYWLDDWNRGADEWAEFNRLKLDDPGSPARIREQGWDTLGGRRAYRMVYELTEAVPDLGNRRMPFLLIDWYFVHEGKAGFLRGISLQRRFPFEYRPIFEEIARRAGYVEPR